MEAWTFAIQTISDTAGTGMTPLIYVQIREPLQQMYCTPFCLLFVSLSLFSSSNCHSTTFRFLFHPADPSELNGLFVALITHEV